MGGRAAADHYYALQMKAERPMANGVTFLVAYNYNQERHTDYFNDIDRYAKQAHDVRPPVRRGTISVSQAPGSFLSAGAVIT